MDKLLPIPHDDESLRRLFKQSEEETRAIRDDFIVVGAGHMNPLSIGQGYHHLPRGGTALGLSSASKLALISMVALTASVRDVPPPVRIWETESPDPEPKKVSKNMLALLNRAKK